MCIKWVAAPLFFSALISFSSHAVIVKLDDLHLMARRCDVIVHGVVGEKSTHVDDMGRLITLITMEAIDPIHGAKIGDLITIYVVGGELEGRVMPILGGHSYRAGDELVFFGLEMGSYYVSYGVGLGKFNVVPASNGKEVWEDLGNVEAFKSTPSGNEIFAPPPLTFDSVTDFKKEVELMLKVPVPRQIHNF